MPCNDNYNDCNDFYKEYRKYEKDLCRSRWILRQLMKFVDKSTIDSNLTKYIDEEKQESLNHRLLDKRNAVDNIKSNLLRYQNDIDRIQKLGGEPSAKLLLEIEKLESKLNQINNITEDLLLDSCWCNPICAVDIK